MRYIDFVKDNYKNLGRYTLDNLMPASYSVKTFATLPKVWTEPLFTKSPVFYGGKKPQKRTTQQMNKLFNLTVKALLWLKGSLTYNEITRDGKMMEKEI